MAEPRYWMQETSGAQRAAIEAYLRGDNLKTPQVTAIQAYLRQWISASVWDENPHMDEEMQHALAFLRRMIGNLNSRVTIDAWLAEAAAMGMDPL
jgi:hypothetical protein